MRTLTLTLTPRLRYNEDPNPNPYTLTLTLTLTPRLRYNEDFRVAQEHAKRRLQSTLLERQERNPRVGVRVGEG